MTRDLTVLITDIDNTIYDFVDAYGPAFRAMVHVVAKETKQPETLIVEQFRRLFQHVGTLDFQNLIRNLEVSKLLSNQAVERLIRHGRRAFDITRRSRLLPYPGMVDALSAMARAGVVIVGATNAPVYHAFSRLEKLKCAEFFTGLIAWEGARLDPDDPLYDVAFIDKQENAFRRARRQFKMFETYRKVLSKPDPHMFCVIRDRFGDAKYVALGDSISKDLTPAAELGMKTLWAKYGTVVNETSLKTVLEITPWSETDVELHNSRDCEPDIVIESPGDLLRFLPSVPLPVQTNLFQ